MLLICDIFCTCYERVHWMQQKCLVEAILKQFENPTEYCTQFITSVKILDLQRIRSSVFAIIKYSKHRNLRFNLSAFFFHKRRVYCMYMTANCPSGNLFYDNTLGNLRTSLNFIFMRTWLEIPLFRANLQKLKTHIFPFISTYRTIYASVGDV